MAKKEKHPPLFLETGQLAPAGSELNSRAGEQLAVWFVAFGPPQEVAAILHAVVTELQCETVLNAIEKTAKKAKQKMEKK